MKAKDKLWIPRELTALGSLRYIFPKGETAAQHKARNSDRLERMKTRIRQLTRKYKRLLAGIRGKYSELDKKKRRLYNVCLAYLRTEIDIIPNDRGDIIDGRAGIYNKIILCRRRLGEAIATHKRQCLQAQKEYGMLPDGTFATKPNEKGFWARIEQLDNFLGQGLHATARTTLGNYIEFNQYLQPLEKAGEGYLTVKTVADPKWIAYPYPAWLG